MDISIPNLGDIDEVEVIELFVAVGDEVAEGDSLLVIESDKASMDVPATTGGTVSQVHVSVGDMVGEGHVIVSLQGVASATKTPATDTAESVEQLPVEEPTAEESQTEPVKTDVPAGAPTNLQILVPDIGDAGGVVVIEVAVAAGATVAVDDLVVVLESDKASMEISAEHAGEITEVLVTVDDEVETGTPLANMLASDVAAEEVTESPAANDQPSPAASTQPTKNPDAQAPSTSQSATAAAPVAPPAAEKLTEDQVIAQAEKVYAGPAVRRLARELGVDLTRVNGTGQRSRITKDDVKVHVKTLLTQPAQGAGGSGIPAIPEVDFAKFGEIEHVKLSRIRKRGAENLHRSWINLPHVTQHDEVDITELEAFRASLKKEAEIKGIRLTPLAFIVKACAHGLKTFPEFNASLHPDGEQLVLKSYINIGMAVDTPEGLVVPVIRDAGNKDLWTLSQDIADLSQKARDKKLAMDDLQGGTFSVSSLGAMGGTGFTPIVNAPEVAILGVAKLQTKPLWDGEVFQPRKVLPLSLSYDHRVINGADGGRFMLHLTSILGDIRRLALD